jgi:hypothetical protein
MKKVLNVKWGVAFQDRGMGHGDYGVMDTNDPPKLLITIKQFGTPREIMENSSEREIAEI